MSISIVGFWKLDEHYHQGSDIKEIHGNQCSFEDMNAVEEMAIRTGCPCFTILPKENGKIQAWFHYELKDGQIGYEGHKIGKCSESKHKGRTLYIRR